MLEIIGHTVVPYYGDIRPIKDLRASPSVKTAQSNGNHPISNVSRNNAGASRGPSPRFGVVPRAAWPVGGSAKTADRHFSRGAEHMRGLMFTLVFDGDLRGYQHNPLTTETMYGVPVAAAIGNGLEDGDTLNDQLAEAREWLQACLGLVEGRGPPNWDGIREFLKQTD